MKCPIRILRNCKTLSQFEKLKRISDLPLNQLFEERNNNSLVRKSPKDLAREIYRNHANILETDILMCERFTPEPWKSCPDVSETVLEVQLCYPKMNNQCQN